MNIRFCSCGASQMSWDHQQHLKSPQLPQLQEAFFCHAKVSVDHHKYFITLMALIYCIRLVICCSRCLTNREGGPLGQWKSKESLFCSCYSALHLSNGTFTHRQPQTNQVLCNYHLSRVVAEHAFCKMKGTRKIFAVKLEISLWFLDKNLLPCYILQTLTAREAYGCKQWEKSQGRTVDVQVSCILLKQRITTRDMLVVCSATEWVIVSCCEVVFCWLTSPAGSLFLALALSHPCHQSSLWFKNHIEKSSDPWSWLQGHQKH